MSYIVVICCSHLLLDFTASNLTLKFLDLSWNHIRRHGARVLVESICVSQCFLGGFFGRGGVFFKYFFTIIIFFWLTLNGFMQSGFKYISFYIFILVTCFFHIFFKLLCKTLFYAFTKVNAYTPTHQLTKYSYYLSIF